MTPPVSVPGLPDIVERLRGLGMANDHSYIADVCNQAAAEIERLRRASAPEQGSVGEPHDFSAGSAGKPLKQHERGSLTLSSTENPQRSPLNASEAHFKHPPAEQVVEAIEFLQYLQEFHPTLAYADQHVPVILAALSATALDREAVRREAFEEAVERVGGYLIEEEKDAYQEGYNEGIVDAMAAIRGATK